MPRHIIIGVLLVAVIVQLFMIFAWKYCRNSKNKWLHQARLCDHSTGISYRLSLKWEASVGSSQCNIFSQILRLTWSPFSAASLSSLKLEFLLSTNFFFFLTIRWGISLMTSLSFKICTSKMLLRFNPDYFFTKIDLNWLFGKLSVTGKLRQGEGGSNCS